MTTEVQGLWMSSNINAATPMFAEVTAYPFKQPERVFFNPYKKDEMWVSSFGNGMKMGSLLATNIASFSNAEQEAIYPNPSSGVIHLKNETAKELEIYNMLGELITRLQLEKGENALDISFLKPGMYLLNWDHQNAKIIRSE
jgi:hypothetical protein